MLSHEHTRTLSHAHTHTHALSVSCTYKTERIVRYCITPTHVYTQQKKEDLEGLMEAWGQGKLREYLAPDLAKIDAADSNPAPAETDSTTQERGGKAKKGD